mmetsp:Transcript_31950/g.46555  ORF Transcript_31950/g.46555 Transcript_31950/m.46555 type:complete len:261 (-) Transcript_31950:626-1408(-)
MMAKAPFVAMTAAALMQTTATMAFSSAGPTNNIAIKHAMKLPNRQATQALLYSSNSNDPLDAKIISSTSTTSSPNSSKSLFGRIDDYGLSLKPKAITAKEKSASLAASQKEGTRTKRLLYTLESCAYFVLFMIYRAYRGFFVILPAVFQEVNRKMTDVIDAPFDEDEVDNNNSLVEPKKPKKRTRITVSILAVLVTASYVVTGASRAFIKFCKTILTSSSVTSSLEAAVDEMIINEEKVKKISSQVKKVNGVEEKDSSFE